jgi:broad specificity phosphatase PhoE
MLQIVLVRHGQSEANVDSHLICGANLDTKLTDLGKKQAKMLGLWWKKQNFVPDQVFASTACRAIETATIALDQVISIDNSKEEQQNVDISISDQLLEIDQGDFVGKHRKEIYTTETQKKIDLDPLNWKAPNGESQLDVETRMMTFIQNFILAKWNHVSNQKVVIFGHGVAFKCLVRGLMESNPER